MKFKELRRNSHALRLFFGTYKIYSRARWIFRNSENYPRFEVNFLELRNNTHAMRWILWNSEEILTRCGKFWEFEKIISTVEQRDYNCEIREPVTPLPTKVNINYRSIAPHLSPSIQWTVIACLKLTQAIWFIKDLSPIPSPACLRIQTKKNERFHISNYRPSIHVPATLPIKPPLHLFRLFCCCTSMHPNPSHLTTHSHSRSPARPQSCCRLPSNCWYLVRNMMMANDDTNNLPNPKLAWCDAAPMWFS